MSAPTDPAQVGLSLADGRVLVDGLMALLIWIVQVVIYPAFRHLDGAAFRGWHEGYTSRITLFVAPLMFAQVALVGLQLADGPTVTRVLAAALVAFTWGATFFVSVPLHGRLQQSGNLPDVVDRLVRTNGVRTAAWTALFALALLDRLAPGAAS